MTDSDSGDLDRALEPSVICEDCNPDDAGTETSGGGAASEVAAAALVCLAAEARSGLEGEPPDGKEAAEPARLPRRESALTGTGCPKLPLFGAAKPGTLGCADIGAEEAGSNVGFIGIEADDKTWCEPRPL
eukprot:gnl/TRDRNA2_/TRDRNA2_157280_c0_seq1.p2 gnl/TRDRNA2_/TRDRNA2_157280_c0~~gnl/TRDRNA2_/TRDRNA2_157280_c0_seq1.p2  ORF type:complete len:131 (-),score=25.11 gnl/TRDRNA2_/TRDRNA2_157280_c0_seq1:104-496(-)